MPVPTDVPSQGTRLRFGGANLLRTLAVLAVLYSHISYYLIDDLGTGWWLIDAVYETLVHGARLNQHLSFLGVAVFMMLTGLLLTASAARNAPSRFLVNRIGRLLPALWVAVAAALAQVEVVLLATDIRAYWAGDRYLWTIVVVAVAVLLLARYDGFLARWSVVHWTGTRSYAIYLLHTLILYRAYDWTVGLLGKTGAVVAFLAATAVAAELLYRAVEVPAGRWIGTLASRVGRPKPQEPDRAVEHEPTRPSAQ